MKQGESETGIKNSKKRKSDNQIYFQQNNKIILGAYVNIMKIIVIWLKAKTESIEQKITCNTNQEISALCSK